MLGMEWGIGRTSGHAAFSMESLHVRYWALSDGWFRQAEQSDNKNARTTLSSRIPTFSLTAACIHVRQAAEEKETPSKNIKRQNYYRAQTPKLPSCRDWFSFFVVTSVGMTRGQGIVGFVVDVARVFVAIFSWRSHFLEPDKTESRQ